MTSTSILLGTSFFAAFAVVARAQDPSPTTPSSSTETPSSPTETPSSPTKNPSPSKTPSSSVSQKQASAAKGGVVAVMGAIEAADRAAATLQELAKIEPMTPGEVRRTAEVAEQAISVAMKQERALAMARDLSQATRSSLREAEKHLQEASTAIEKMQRQVGIVAGPFRGRDVERVRAWSEKLQQAVFDARSAIKPVAEEYGVAAALDEQPSPPDVNPTP